MATLPATLVAESLKKANVGISAICNSPSLTCKQLQQLPPNVAREQLESAISSLKLQTRMGSFKCVASGLRLWHTFACAAGLFGRQFSSPKVCARCVPVCRNFRKPRDCQKLCGVFEMGVRIHVLVLGLRGLHKQYVASRAGALTRRRLMHEDLLTRLLTLADGIDLFSQLGDVVLLSWQALLRVQSEALPLNQGTFEDVHDLPPGRHSAVFVDPANTLHLRLRQRKHRPQGSLLVRPCVCGPHQRSPLCVGHRLAVRLGQLSRGQRLFTLTQSVVLIQVFAGRKGSSSGSRRFLPFPGDAGRRVEIFRSARVCR